MIFVWNNLIALIYVTIYFILECFDNLKTIFYTIQVVKFFSIDLSPKFFEKN